MPGPFRVSGLRSRLRVPNVWEELRAMKRVEYLEEDDYNPLRKLLQSLVRSTVWAWSLADLETPDGILNSSGVC